MNKVLILICCLGLLAIGSFILVKNLSNKELTTAIPVPVDTSSPARESVDESSKDLIIQQAPKMKVVATGLSVPWAIAFLPDGGMLVTERAGRVRLIDKNGNLRSEPIATISEVKPLGEGGLHGVALHPDFDKNHYIYLYYTYGEFGNQTLNRVSRFIFDGNSFSDQKIIVDKIPGASNHDGGRIKFDPDGLLYITTGDASQPSLAQNKDSLAGKILRVTDEGQAASGNPFGTRIYSYGHRNPQGITWDSQGSLWATEHGQSATDELNLIEPGKNYGWPEIRGDQTSSGMESPILQSGTDTWAPAGAAFFEGSIYFGGLRAQILYQAIIDGNKATLKTHFKGKFGRIREVILGPDNMLYITTSNRDGRGNPTSDDDRIIMINPQKL